MDEKIDRSVFRDLSYGLYIIATRHEDKANAQIVNTVIQVTSQPPRVAVIVHKDNYTHELIQKSKLFSASVMAETAPITLIGPLGYKSGRDLDKMAKIEYEDGITGCPMVTEHALSVLEAEVIEEVDLGSHTIFIGNVVSSKVVGKGTPLTYHYYHTVMRGKSPPKAPTFEAK